MLSLSLVVLIISLSSAPVALICLIIALVLFVLAALNVPSSRVSLGWLGLFCLTLAIALG